MITYIDENKARFGVEPICRHLPIAPSTYHDAKTRPPSAREPRDEQTRAGTLKADGSETGGRPPSRAASRCLISARDGQGVVETASLG